MHIIYDWQQSTAVTLVIQCQGHSTYNRVILLTHLIINTLLCFLVYYCLALDDIFKRHQLQYHMYADDTQLYVEFPRDQQVPATAATNRIALCTADVKTWMASHNLLLNEHKTEVVVIAAPNRSRVHRPVVVAIDVCGVSVTPKPSIRDIGVEIDDTMSMAVHVCRVCQVTYCHIRRIAKIRKCLTTTTCTCLSNVSCGLRQCAAFRITRDAAA